MYLADIINAGSFIEERISYIFNAFQSYFPNVRYDERSSIVGIGEPEKHLLCYFKQEENDTIAVKFKSSDTAMSLMEDIQVIDSHIKATVEIFQTNNFPLHTIPTKSKKRKQVNVLAGKGAIDIVPLLRVLVIKDGGRKIEDIASNRLTNALRKAGINKIADLAEYDYSRLVKLKGFGDMCYCELCDILFDLKYGERQKEPNRKNIDILCQKATKENVRQYAKNEEIISSLTAIRFDENYFNEGTIGRVLCLRQKVKERKSLFFCNEAESLKEIYLANESQYEIIFQRTKELLLTFAEQRLKEPRKALTLLLLEADGKKYTFEDVGEIYGHTRQWANQQFKKALTTLAYSFDLYCEDGLLRYIKRREYFTLFSTCPVEAFILYLKLTKHDNILRAFYRVILHNITLPKVVEDRVDEAYNQLKKLKDKKTDKSAVSYKGFQFLVDANGELLTDLELLKKLQKARLDIANKLGLPAYCIYHDKQLVMLATYKPTNKNMYEILKGFTYRTWDKYGFIMINIINEHIKNH